MRAKAGSLFLSNLYGLSSVASALAGAQAKAEQIGTLGLFTANMTLAAGCVGVFVKLRVSPSVCHSCELFSGWA